ncbi:EAL domain-containing protein [Thiomicrospira sp. WB1]|uniref:EAL domain-containing protein n=1 Tax=Thiomicrospira sp. WB1 TaxID=1685380 RepID=UPI0007485579|nr:EAL domain-containing protein [Thiomicrospira sp. WB1]KUJ72363.1 diguanylate cyclase [Thiomicrospira sp. WB1]
MSELNASSDLSSQAASAAEGQSAPADANLVVSHFMHAGIETCAPDTPIKQVIRYLSRKNIGSILVSDDEDVVGIWTRTDLLKLDITHPEILSEPIRTVMNSPVCRIHQDELVSSATYLFHKKHIHHLLVVDHAEYPVGVVSESDLVNAKFSDGFLDAISIRELLNGHLHYIEGGADLCRVQKAMANWDVDALVVADQGDYGIVSMRDLLRCFAERETFEGVYARDIASFPLQSVLHTQSLSYVRQYMVSHNFHHIGVEDENGNLVDLISFSELLHQIEENFYYQTSRSIKEKEQRILEAETLYRDLLSLSNDGVVIYQDNVITFANDEACRMLDMDEAALIGKDFLSLLPQSDRAEFRARLAAFDHHKPEVTVACLCTASGASINVELNHKPITYHAEPAHLLVITDLTLQEESERFQKLTRSVFDNAGEGILVTDKDNRFVLVNRTFEQITGYTSEEVLGLDPVILSSGKQTGSFYAQMWQSLQDTDSWEGEIWNRKKDGTIYPEWLTINAVRDKEGEVLHYVGLMNDLSKQKETEEEINRLSFYDILTGLPNVTLFKNRLNQVMAKNRRTQDKMALLIIDIARFKMINDALGYEHGDRLLVQIAQRLETLLGTEDAVARMGADNFLVLIEPIQEADQAAALAKKLIKGFETPFEVDGQAHVIDIKIGIALNEEESQKGADLMKSADEALFEAKKLPHSGYVFHSSELTTATSELFFYEKELRRGIEQQELQAYFQPQICLQTNQVMGAEALVRWLHPDMGVVAPNKFIGISESTGLIIPLGRQILKQACEQWQAWSKMGLRLSRISVNVSKVQLVHQAFVDSVAQVLAETGIPPEVLELEVTESFLLQNEQEGIRVLNELKQLGVLLSMDDFGTGFSSLSYLKKLPLDQLKIDQSFVRSLPENNEDRAIVDAVVAVGKAVGVEVIAEGVETSTQADYLQNQGCDLGQGYGFARPMPPAEFPDWWRTFDARNTETKPSA